MHVLTKIFIVLVSLLAVLLVPLVVVYAHNENSYQARYLDADAQTKAARSALKTAQASHGAALALKDGQLSELETMNLELQRQADRAEAEIRELQARVTEAESMDAEVMERLSTLASALSAGQQLEDSLIAELRTVRRDALLAERQKVELDEALRDALAKLDAANEARRAIREELQRWKDEHARAIQDVAEFTALYGPLDRNVAAGERRGIAPDRNLEATIVQVRRTPDQVLAEIDAGQRDGVQIGWLMTIHDGSFIARLRIIEVDINRSVGVVELEDEFAGRRVEAFQRVIARRPE